MAFTLEVDEMQSIKCNPRKNGSILEYLQISQVMTDLLTPVVNKVPGFYFKGLTALVNKPPNMQIFAPSKFEINRSTDLKVMAKKF